jgi:3alpha(or 20beta)-hydroxysteroid dehydrogenase
MGKLDGKVAIVTGAARGMGATHSRRFVAEGARVAMTDRDREAGQAEASAIGPSARFYEHDVTRADSWRQLIEEVEADFGPVDILVNNAGIGYSVHIDRLEEAEFLRFFEVNQLGVFLGMKAVIPSMRRAGGGSIVNVSSTCGMSALEGTVAYAGTKFAVRGMTKAAAIDLGKDRIRFNSVHPGMTRTGMLESKVEAALKDKIPLKRVSDPDEVSSLVLYLASNDSSYSSGSEFIVDGGLLAQH